MNPPFKSSKPINQTTENLVKLSELSIDIVDCLHDKKPDFVESSDYVYLEVRNVGLAGDIDQSDLRYVTEEVYEHWIRRLKPQAGDIVISKTGRVGAIAIITPDLNVCVGRNLVLIRPDSNKIVPQYLRFYMLSPVFRREVKKLALSGTILDSLHVKYIPDLGVRYHPKEIQEKTVRLLLPFLTLLETNSRRIKVLEELARTIYREWFVHFRFPGHEDVETVDSELGAIPEGWEVKRIKDAFDILGGGTPSTKKEEYWIDGDINWYTPSDLTLSGTMFMDRSSRKITELGLKKSSAKMFPPFSVMMTSRATLGVVSISTSPACTNQGFIICIPNDQVSMYHIYFWIKDNVERIIALGTGTTYKEIIKSVFREIEFLVAPQELKNRFEEVVLPMGELVLNLQRQNAILSEARDLLLPRLVSGEIDMSLLAIEVSTPNTRKTSKYEKHPTLDQWLDGGEKDGSRK